MENDIELAVTFESIEETFSSSKFSPCNESDTEHDKYVIATIFYSSFLHQIFYHSFISNLPR